MRLSLIARSQVTSVNVRGAFSLKWALDEKKKTSTIMGALLFFRLSRFPQTWPRPPAQPALRRADRWSFKGAGLTYFRPIARRVPFAVVHSPIPLH